jgi:hypothetical protein
LTVEALDILRRLETDVRTLRQEIASLRRSVGQIEDVQSRTELNRSTNRITVYFAALWIGALALLFAALQYWPPHG